MNVTQPTDSEPSVACVAGRAQKKARPKRTAGREYTSTLAPGWVKATQEVRLRFKVEVEPRPVWREHTVLAAIVRVFENAPNKWVPKRMNSSSLVKG